MAGSSSGSAEASDKEQSLERPAAPAARRPSDKWRKLLARTGNEPLAVIIILLPNQLRWRLHSRLCWRPKKLVEALADGGGGRVSNSTRQGLEFGYCRLQENTPDLLTDNARPAATLQLSDVVEDVPASRTGSPTPGAPSSVQRQGSKRRAQKGPSDRSGTEDQHLRSSVRKSSQYKGVSWSERSHKWRAQMWYGNKVQPFLGLALLCLIDCSTKA